MKKKYPIVMLPTEKATNLVLGVRLFPETKLKYIKTPYSGDHNAIPQHLYILSEIKDIKIGEWYIDDCDNIRQATTDDEDYWNRRQDYKKVLVTTNKSLTSFACNQDFGMCGEECLGTCNKVKTIPESFLPIFVEASYNEGNLITEVELEYDVKPIRNSIATLDKLQTDVFEPILKTTESNEVIISLPEVKMYSRKEVEILVLKAIEDCDGDYRQCRRWTERNL
jgi:hypothetical protein